MRRLVRLLILIPLIVTAAACQVGPGRLAAPTPVETDACCLNQQPGLEETIAASAALETAVPAAASPAPTGTADLPEPPPSPSPVVLPGSGAASDLIRQKPMFGWLEPYQVEEVAAGSYPAGAPFCGESYLLSLPPQDGEIVLTLTYAAPLVPEQIEILTGDQPHGILRVEVLNALSGLGRLVYQAGSPIQEDSPAGGPCARRLVLPARVDFEVDTIFIAFESLEAVAQVGVVELIGSLEAYVDLPVFWRVPLPGAPLDLAAGPGGLVYVAVEPNGLYAYDVEGNQLKAFSLPPDFRPAGLSVDKSGSLIVSDAYRGGFLVLSPDGDQLAAGSSETAFAAAVNPVDGNYYQLRDNTLFVYTTGTAERVRQVALSEDSSYAGLAFDARGRAFTLGDYDWSVTLQALDPFTGEVLDAAPLERSNQVEIVARDLAVDENGSVFVLFSMNAAQIAVHMLDSQGNFLRRFGSLSSDPDDWPEGSFLDPRAITVSPDGRFILIADGFEGSAFLTAFLMEPQ